MYEQFKNQVMLELSSKFSNDLISKVGDILDRVAVDYDINKKLSLNTE